MQFVHNCCSENLVCLVAIVWLKRILVGWCIDDPILIGDLVKMELLVIDIRRLYHLVH